MKYVRYTLWIVLAASTASSAACGWRLQGTAKLPEAMAAAYIETSDRHTPFHLALREGLRSSGARLAGSAGEATAIVKILEEESGQRVLSVSARNTPEEYEVYYMIEYSVANRDGELIAPQKIELTRDYSFDETAVLAKQREQRILRDALARDLASQVLRRLSAL